MDSESSPPPPPRRHRPHYPDYTKADSGQLPWKYTGYRVFTRGVASDQAFSIVRRFGTLNARVIFGMQNELMSLERTLDLMDEEYSRKEMPDVTNNGSYTYAPFIDRKNLITEILPK